MYMKFKENLFVIIVFFVAIRRIWELIEVKIYKRKIDSILMEKLWRIAIKTYSKFQSQ